MKVLCVIPARYASTRLPGKPLSLIAGKPMIQHVYERACQAKLPDEVVVATDNELVKKAVDGFGGKAMMTSPDHPSGTDRLAEVVHECGWDDETIVVNVQGDEPLIDPTLPAAVARQLASTPAASMATAAHPLHTLEEFANPNVVKVVCNARQLALYFSRAAIPCWRDAPSAGALAWEQHPAQPLRHRRAGE